MVEKAMFAGGCFWCIESAFAHKKGVLKATSGLTGGHTENPTYDQVHKSDTGHREAVEIEFDADVVSYGELVEYFWHQIDPTDSGGQFADRGQEYTTAIYYFDNAQKQIAEKSKNALAESKKFNKPIATEILPAGEFYKAEEYHQEYWKKNPIKYKTYKALSGRDEFINENWSK